MEKLQILFFILAVVDEI